MVAARTSPRTQLVVFSDQMTRFFDVERFEGLNTVYRLQIYPLGKPVRYLALPLLGFFSTLLFLRTSL